jgi:NDP-mannose synthase
MQAVILAGGKGTRMRPFTFSLPKPLVPIGDHPILDIVLSQLKRAGAQEVVLSTGYLAELLQAYCGDGSKWGLRLRYAHENTPLNTAGALSRIESLDDNFLVMNGDILTLLDYREIWKHHLAAGSIATIGVCEKKVQIDLGVIEMEPSHLLKSYKEKPELSYHVSMGINILNKRALGFMKPGESLSMPELLLRLKKAGEKISCFLSNKEWLDIGRPEDYQLAQERFETARRSYLPD